VWNADDPAAAVRTYVEALRRAEVTA
jgi:hypothetical protein